MQLFKMAFYNYNRIFLCVALFWMTDELQKSAAHQNTATEDSDVLKNVLQELKAIKKDLNSCKLSTNLLQEEVNRMKDDFERLRVNDRIQSRTITKEERVKRDIQSYPITQSSYRVAFTAYLDHHVTHLGDSQAIIYNKVLINEGAAYNSYNGMFTAPKSGVYIFSCSCTARQTGSVYDIWVSLIVNAATQATAVAESRSGSYDRQGSSTVIIHVNKGDIVWTKRLSSGGAEIHSEPERRVSSFTGALLFADAPST